MVSDDELARFLVTAQSDLRHTQDGFTSSELPVGQEDAGAPTWSRCQTM